MCSGGEIATQAELLSKYKAEAERNDSDELTASMRDSILSAHNSKPLLKEGFNPLTNSSIENQ